MFPSVEGIELVEQAKLVLSSVDVRLLYLNKPVSQSVRSGSDNVSELLSDALTGSSKLPAEVVVTEEIGRVASVDTKQPVHTDIIVIVSSRERDLQRKPQVTCVKTISHFASAQKPII